MKALILAAGQGTRIRPAHGDRPKCPIQFNGSTRTILDQQIDSLLSAGVEEIGIVVGYGKDDIVRHLARRPSSLFHRFRFIENPVFAETNNIYSFWLARGWLTGARFVCLNADVVNVAEEIARKLEMNYVFGREFQELTQGSRDAPAYHGQATLSRWCLGNARVVRFRSQSGFWRPRWFLPRTEPFQERTGGRIALVTEVEIRGLILAVYNLHLESRGDDKLRRSQLEEALEDATRYAPHVPALLAGDLNFDVSQSVPTLALRRAGFRSAIALPSPHTTTPRGLFRYRRTIDWAYVSGPVGATCGHVHAEVGASDHYPISFTLGFEQK